MYYVTWRRLPVPLFHVVSLFCDICVVLFLLSKVATTLALKRLVRKLLPDTVILTLRSVLSLGM